SAPLVAGHLAAALDRPLLVVTPHIDQTDRVRDDLETFLARPVDLLPAWESLPTDSGGDMEIADARIRLCAALCETPHGPSAEAAGPPRTIIVAPVQALIQPVPTAEALSANALSLRVGAEIDLEQVARWLVDRGFERLDQVEQPGDFAIRGGILD